MHIAKVEIEVVKMTREEEHALWNEWREHYVSGKDVFICGHLMQQWDTDDGNNMLLILRDGVQQWLWISREK
jgi:hypothetical protein